MFLVTLSKAIIHHAQPRTIPNYPYRNIDIDYVPSIKRLPTTTIHCPKYTVEMQDEETSQYCLQLRSNIRKSV